MEYTVQKLARLAGISTRTLRYYDEIGLLPPARTSASGYRIYGQVEVDRLQQILLYRELGVTLETIREIVTDPAFDRLRALREHREQLLNRRRQLDLIITSVENTIAMTEGRMPINDKEKFDGFKQTMVADNEKKYGKEIRERYGDDSVKRSNEKVLNMTPEQYEEVTKLAREVKTTLSTAFKMGDPASEIAQQAADLHKRWLTCHWSDYSPAAHAGVAQMYVDDERFRAYYDDEQPGTAEFLRDAVHIYTGCKQ